MNTRLTRGGWLHAFVDFERIGARFFKRGERLCGLAGAGIANVAIFGPSVRNKLVRHRIADQSARNTNSARCIQHMDDGPGIYRLNTQCRVGF